MAAYSVRRSFGADLRSLAAFRIALAGILLYDICDRARDLNVFYTDAGILPRETAVKSFPRIMQACVHLATGSWQGEAVLFLLMGLCALALLAGWRTRLASVLCWYLWVSLQCRTPPILYGMDNLLRLLLMWGMFLPWGARFSVDAAAAGGGPREAGPHLSAATAAVLLQVAIMYWFTASLKSGDEWVKDGSALYYALRLDNFSTSLGARLREFPGLCRQLTFATLGWEWLGPFLLFSPVAFLPLRLAAIGGFCALQAGIFAFMAVGLFPALALTAMIPFVPPEAWALRFRGRGRLEALAGRVREAAARIPGAGPPAFRLSRGGSILVWLLLAYVFAWNLVTPSPAGIRVPDWARVPGYLLRLDQDWTMFAPFPMKDDGWFVVRGLRRDGKAVDLRSGREGEPSLAKPRWLHLDYKNKRWKKFMLNLREDRWLDQRQNYGDWLCRRYNAGRVGEDRLAELTVLYFMTESLPASAAPPVKRTFLHYYCY